MNTIKPAIYTVVFEDETTFIGGNNYFETKWIEIPNKKIKRLFYRLPGGDYLCLAKYDKYFHMVEATKDLNGENKGEAKLNCIYLFGQKNNQIVRYKIDLLNLGRFEKRILDINDKQIKGLNPNNWK